MFRYLTLFILLGFNIILNAIDPEELGKVEWYRDLEEAQLASENGEKPILILFQEVPGCLTCKTYGKVVLSHPLIVETIETYFIPLAIYNNRRGKDATVLNYYQEPSWNNPVVRIIASDKSDVLPRLNGDYTPSGLVDYMMRGMQKLGYPVPDYLPLLFEELSANERGVEKTTLSMYCFWTGEKELGKIDGVIRTEAGFMDHQEVVNVYFDPKIVSFEKILQKGQDAKCADRVYVRDELEKIKAHRGLGTEKVKEAGNFRLDKEPKYYLNHTNYKFVPMTPIQAVKINSLIGEGKSPLHLLSPRQHLMFNYLQKNPSATWSSMVNDTEWENKIFEAWQALGYRS